MFISSDYCEWDPMTKLWNEGTLAHTFIDAPALSLTETQHLF